MKHLDTIQREFGRQAEAFSTSPALSSPDVTERIARALHAGTVARILDLACGPGVLAETLSPRARQVIALDLTRETLHIARTRCLELDLRNVFFTRGVAETPPLRPRSFDVVVLRLALHHFEHPGAVLGEVRPLLRPDGRLIILDLLTCDDPETARLHNSIERLRDPSHTALFSQAELRRQVRGAGFDLVSATTWKMVRQFDEWARIITEPQRMNSLEVVLRHLARAGVRAGIDLREERGKLWFTYTWCLLVGEPDGQNG